MSASQDPVLFIRRNPAPGVNLVDHARGLGINLRTKTLKTYGSPRRGVASPRSQTATLTHRSAKSCPPSVICFPQPTQYIENIVIPLTANTDETGAKNSMTPRPYSASYLNPKLRPRSASRPRSSLPNMRSRSAPGPNYSPRSSAKSIRTLSTYLDKYNVSSTPLGQSYVAPGQGQESYRKWNASEQATRFEKEQFNRAKGQTLKRTSEIRPHRLDRMYYMSGTSVRPSSKYEVDDSELERLKSLSQARHESRHYGRGLSSHRGDRYMADVADKEPPQQPPPSSLSQNPDLHPLVPEGTIVNREARDTDVDDDSVTLDPTRPSTAVTAKKGDKIEETPESEENINSTVVATKKGDESGDLLAQEVQSKAVVKEDVGEPAQENSESKENILTTTDNTTVEPDLAEENKIHDNTNESPSTFPGESKNEEVKNVEGEQNDTKS